MGLNISPGRATWSYSGFMSFRRMLAEAAGFDLDQAHGFHREGHPPTTIDWCEDEHVNESWGCHLRGVVDGIAHTPLRPLLSHSDCEGYLNPSECAEVYPRLMEILGTWPENIETTYDRQMGYRLASGMEHCVAHGCAMRFH